MSKIQAINKESVHRICSGQVVLNLATAVKELVENSLDAGATSVEVSLKDYGSELVEVSDNGGGVHPDNYEGLTLKHHTSKLQEFTDLTSVETFGFRGEALSSLCALSKVTITTKHKDSNVGHRLEFDHHGHIKNKTAVSRQVGTTVSLQGLFSTLPVRQKEFHRHLKKEFAKMTQVLYGYCLVALGVKLSCVNISKQGSRTTLVSTMGSSSLRENISCVFGPKQLQNIVSISQSSPDAAMLEEFKTSATEDNIFTLGGFISSAMHGHGRASTDRQFYFVNSRPCEPAKIVKLVNEVYHQFNSSQYPFIVLCIDVARACVDVNVTPDKRQLFLDHEKLLLATVKATLLKLFEYAPCTLPVNTLSLPTPSSSPSPAPDSVSPISLAMLNRWRHGSDKRKSGPVSEGQGKQKQMKLMDSFFSVTKDCPHEPNQDATDSNVKDPRVPNDDEGYESQQNRNAQNEKLSSTSLIPNEDEDNNSMNITTMDPLNENIMSFDSDEDADNPTAQTTEETNEVSIEIKGENASVLNDTTGINYLNNRTVSRLGDNVEENVNMSNSDVNTSSNSISNYIPTPDNCDTREDPYSPYQESNINHDCSSVQSSPNSSISNDYRIGRKSISTRTVNKLDMFKKTSTNTTHSSANAGSKSGLNFLDRLARFKSNSRNIVEINNPKPKEEPTEKVITILNRPTSDRYSPDLTEQNLRKSQTLVDIQNIDTAHADLAKFKVKKEVEDSEATNRVDEDNDALEIKHESPKGGKENGSLLCDFSTTSSSSKSYETEDQVEVINILDDMAPSTGNYRCSASIEFSVETMREKIQQKYERRISKAKTECLENKFHAEINPSKNKEAESELSRVISKSMFDQMIIVGQFNLGFIIVKYDKDLFIIDQHATDEKYNFETLQKTTVIKSQKLAVPQNLHLTKMNQCVLKDHLNVFYKNGFEFSLDSSPAQASVLLTSVPMSRSTTFGREDIDELLFMIQNTNNAELARPSRIRSMFASRACRKSVMIGKALSRGDMSTLVRHMGTIDQPWNCPHGRPTMRHLINLSLLVHNDASEHKS